MKLILPLLVLLFASCSKSEDVQPPAKTYFTVTNSIDYDLQNVVVGYDKKLITNLGSLNKGAVSTQTETATPTVNIFFDSYGSTFAIMDPFIIKAGQMNTLVINHGATVVQVKKTDAVYPK